MPNQQEKVRCFAIAMVFISVSLLLPAVKCLSQVRTLDNAFHHLRNGDIREWSGFPLHAESEELIVIFSGSPNNSEQTLILRQYDVKQNWQVFLNNNLLGSLVEDEKDLLTYLPVKPGAVRDGQNIIRIAAKNTVSDDIRVGEVFLNSRPMKSVLSESTIDLEVIDENDQHIPSHLTFIGENGALQTVSGAAHDGLAIRQGHVYSASGKVSITLPAGTYTVYAGRGFEYSIDSAIVSLRRGERLQKTLRIKREVDTRGWVASDTHIHTYTHSGHGDAADRDRVITIAGEGIELPVITDHNVHVDLQSEAMRNNVNKYFTLVMGNELTTGVGHFNIFPVSGNDSVADHRGDSWTDLSNAIMSTHARAIILNHARDIHRGFRPFDSTRFLPSAGACTDGEQIFFNAMEVLNSGSQQTDIMQLTCDWFGMLNHGHFLTPVGSSDSHDVSRFIVGQGRTYIQCDDTNPGNLDAGKAVENFVQGKVTVSAGLLVTIKVNGQYGPGELVHNSRKVSVSVDVHGPAWTTAERVTLFINGKKDREAKIDNGTKGGIKWHGSWTLDVPEHDIFLVAVAEGPGENMPFWPVAKPFQPVSETWRPRVIGITGVVWIDGDGNGRRNSARDYASELVKKYDSDFSSLIKALNHYDEAVASQAAIMLWENKVDLTGQAIQHALQDGNQSTTTGFSSALKDIRESANPH